LAREIGASPTAVALAELKVPALPRRVLDAGGGVATVILPGDLLGSF
jgi:hypothetical protein